MAAVKQFSAKQKTAMTWWANPRYQEYDAIICDGAVRSGKTLSMGMGFFLWAMRRFSGEQFALCGKTIVSLRRNVLHEILPKVTALGFHCEEKRSENLVIVRSGGRENRFYLFGGYDEGSAALIQGVTLAGVLFDEAALMPRSFVEQASARCSVSGSKLWFNCNPEGPMHWFYREWILRAEERGALYLHFTMDDNPSLSPRIRARYEKAYSGTFYRRFILGEWTAAKGLIYDFFTPEEYCRSVPEQPWERVRISIDYGTVNPMSFGMWALKDGVWYRVKEYYYDARKEGRQKTDAEYLEDLKRFAAGQTVETAKEYIRQHYAESDLSVEKLCAYLHLSSTYFSTLFKRETGTSFTAYVTTVRMEAAAEAIRGTEEKTYLIAQRCGYEDPNYFSYVFKRHFGVTPTKYRSEGK